MNHTQDNAVATAQRALAKAQPGDCLVVDRAGRRYLITDVDTLRRIQENFAPVDALGKQMETLGKQMEAFSKPMEDLGKQMEAKGKVMEGIGQKMEEQGKLLEAAFNEGKPEADRKAIQDQMHALQEQMKVPQEEMQALSKQMRDQGGKMHPLGDQMREFGRQMRVIAKEAQEKMSGIIDTAFANNLAVEQKAP
jgi:predicted  nucleic acid-binding Zn-ribbon protein